MKPLKKKSKKKRKPSSSSPPKPAALGGGDDPQIRKEEKGEGEDEERKALDWLIDAFASVSLDQVESALREAGGDPYKAAGILGTQLEDPGEGPAASGAKKGLGGSRKQKRVAAATGMVSDVIGKGYSKPSAFCGEGGRKRTDGSLEGKGALNRLYSVEEAEEFLCSMLGESSELGMGVVKDVLGQCGCDVEKALDALLDISASSYNQDRSCDTYSETDMNYSGICPELSSNNHSEKIISSCQSTDKTSDSTYNPCEKELEFLQDVGYDYRDYSEVVESEVPPASRSERMKADLQQKVLESLFNTTNHPECEPNLMNWKKVVEKVESFGQGLEFRFPSITDTQQSEKNGKEDTYQVLRSVAKKHWDMMKTYYQQAAIAYSRGERAHASHLSEKGKFYRDLAREADEKASREIFEARNRDIKNTITIDLHGQHVQQASRLLKLHLLLFVYIPSVHFLKVITGRGADAAGNGKGKLKHMVLGLAEKEGIKWREENAGTIILHLDGLKEYSFMDCDADDFE